MLGHLKLVEWREVKVVLMFRPAIAHDKKKYPSSGRLAPPWTLKFVAHRLCIYLPAFVLFARDTASRWHRESR